MGRTTTDDGVPLVSASCQACSGTGTVWVPDRQALTQRRELAGVSQSAVAREAGWFSSYVSELEGGSRPMTVDSARRYLLALQAAESRGAGAQVSMAEAVALLREAVDYVRADGPEERIRGFLARLG